MHLPAGQEADKLHVFSLAGCNIFLPAGWGFQLLSPVTSSPESPVTSSPDPLQKARPTVTGVTVYWQGRQTLCTQFVVNTPFSVPTALTSTHFAW